MSEDFSEKRAHLRAKLREQMRSKRNGGTGRDHPMKSKVDEVLMQIDDPKLFSAAQTALKTKNPNSMLDALRHSKKEGGSTCEEEDEGVPPPPFSKEEEEEEEAPPPRHS